MQERKRKKLKKEVKVFLSGLGAGFVLLLLAIWFLGGKSEKTQATLASTSQTNSQSSQSSQVSQSGQSSQSSQASSSQATTPQATASDQTGATSTASEEPTNTSASTATTTSTGMNLDQIVAGNFSSIAGTWASSRGVVYTFNDFRLTTDGFALSHIAYTDRGTVEASLSSQMEGVHMEFVPAGVSMTMTLEYGATFEDASDVSVDRIWLGHSFEGIEDSADFLYKVD